MDHVESRYKSIRGHTGSFIFSNGNFAAVYPQATKNDADATDSLRRFCDDVGVPANLKVDMAATFTGRHTDFQRAINKYGIKLTFAEPYRHNQLQQVDVAIRDLKRRWRHVMTTNNIPRRLWCFGFEHQARLMQFIPQGHNERTGFEMITDFANDMYIRSNRMLRNKLVESVIQPPCQRCARGLVNSDPLSTGDTVYVKVDKVGTNYNFDKPMLFLRDNIARKINEK